MGALNIDVTAIVGILMAGAVLLIPILGLTARFVVPPIIEAVAQARAVHGSARTLAGLEKRLVRLERQIERLSRESSAKEASEPERELASLGI